VFRGGGCRLVGWGLAAVLDAVTEVAAAGDLAAARSAYRASLDIAARLAAADPANTPWQREAAAAQQKLNDVLGGTS